MRRLPGFAVVLTAFLTLCTGEQIVTEASRGGSIRGQVLSEDSASVEGAQVAIGGSNLVAFTDSAGRFALYGVPAGEYELRISAQLRPALVPVSPAVWGDTVLVVPVGKKDSVDLAGIVLRPQAPLASGGGGFTIEGMMALDRSGFASQFTPSFGVVVVDSAGRIRSVSGVPQAPIEIEMVQMRLLFQVVTSSGQRPAVVWTTVTKGGDTLYDSLTYKGLVRTAEFATRGHDTVVIRINHGDSVPCIIQNPDLIPKVLSSLFITTGRPEIKPLVSRFVPYTGTGSEHAVVVGKDTVVAVYPVSEAVDWDLYLVNKALRDTCSWRNPRPVWGTDLPEFSGDGLGQFTQLRTTVKLPVSSSSYEPDRIYDGNVAAGTYSVLVNFYAGPADRDTATPMVCIELGIDSTVGPAHAFFERAAPRPLKQGEWWYVGTITLPEDKLDTTGAWVGQR